MFAQLITIAIENLLHFLEYFDDKVDFTKNVPLGNVKVRSVHLSSGFFFVCFLFFFLHNAEGFQGEKIVQKFSAILNFATCQQVYI